MSARPGLVAVRREATRERSTPVGPSGRRRRILQLITTFDRGGTESQFVELVNRLAGDPRLDIFIACIRRRGPLLGELDRAVPAVREFPFARFYRPEAIGAAWRLRRFVVEHRFDVVHAWDFYTSLLCAIALGLRPRPELILSRRYLSREPRLHRIAERGFLRLADCVVFNSESVCREACSAGLVRSGRVRVVHNGIDARGYAKGLKDYRERRRSATKRRIGMVARMDGDKDHSTLIKAFGLLATQWPKLELILVGDGRRRARLESEAAALGVLDRVRFEGERGDVRPWLAALDVAVLASKRESLPNVVLEYLAMGIPVVASDVGGVPDIIRDGSEGLLVPPEDALGLGAAIDSLLRAPERRLAMSEAGRRRALDFTFEKAVLRLSNLYLSKDGG